ncbi:DUF397 domain-containing protein [Streptomyces sp. MBT65]|uniref:DUF397 domain-containing protein n=1 Tax=Streptomyces sp. MBT65 TaxID=1488395 RepID=UPI00190D0D4B|nr:DUF397 domain-containing protein [Streptomyces sp. MBT65]MBK3572692.1 DUF397 domain-containing protein [Streptomyces sp. MBT65]
MSPDPTDAVWSKSSYSGGSEGQCVEIANVISTHRGIAIRDSENPSGPPPSGRIRERRAMLLATPFPCPQPRIEAMNRLRLPSRS